MAGHADNYVFYWNGPFSQWYGCQFELDGKAFNSAEQAMMYLKAILFEDDQKAGEILIETDPGRQKALGQQVKGFSNAVWNEQKVKIVERINDAKFRQNKGLRRKLFQTENKQLVEASPVDTIWGIGLSATQAAETDPSLWPGQNLLGRIITNVKYKLAEDFPEEAHAYSVDPKEKING